MPWNEVKTMDQKKDFIDLVNQNDLSFSECCRQFSISRVTGYKWFKRYKTSGLEGLLELDRKPHNNGRELDEDTVREVLQVRYARPSMGPRKIKAYLENTRPNETWPAASSIGNLLDRHKLTRRRRKRNRVPITAPLSHCNDVNQLWSVDFKGAIRLENRKAYEPLTICDAHSRFLIQCVDLQFKDTEYVWAIYEQAFYEYGLPIRIRTDNGPPFGSCAAGRLTSLAVKLIKAGVIPEWINPGCPEENGRHERMHRSLEESILLSAPKTHKEFGDCVEDFLSFYNYERPHEALGQKPPSSIFTTSPRKWCGRLKSPEYSSLFDVREVSKAGQIEHKGKKVFITGSLVREPVGLKENAEGFLEVFYGPIYLGKIGTESRLIKPEMPGRVKRKFTATYY